MLFVLLFYFSFTDSFTHTFTHTFGDKGNPTIVYDDLSLKKCKGDKEYSIHGWWPEHNQTSYPLWCNKTEFANFNDSSIESIRGELDKYWYACPEWKMKNMDFWSHELEKHASCIKDETLLHYFIHTLKSFTEALSKNWYGCCNTPKTRTECLIPFSRTLNETKWLGYCH